MLLSAADLFELKQSKSGMHISRAHPSFGLYVHAVQEGQRIPCLHTVSTDNKQYLTNDLIGGVYDYLYVKLSDLPRMPLQTLRDFYDTKEEHEIRIIEKDPYRE